MNDEDRILVEAFATLRRRSPLDSRTRDAMETEIMQAYDRRRTRSFSRPVTIILATALMGGAALAAGTVPLWPLSWSELVSFDGLLLTLDDEDSRFAFVVDEGDREEFLRRAQDPDAKFLAGGGPVRSSPGKGASRSGQAIRTSANAFASDGDRKARDIVADLDRISYPSMSRDPSEEGQRRFHATIERIARRQQALAQELYDGYPDHHRVPEALAHRWATMTNTCAEAVDVVRETEAILSDSSREAIRREAFLARAWAAHGSADYDHEVKVRYLEEAASVAPDSQGVGIGMVELAQFWVSDPVEMRRLCERALELFPNESHATPSAKGYLKKLDRLGRPMPFSFDDIRTGKKIDSSDYRGKLVLVHVWNGSGLDDHENLRKVIKRWGPRGLEVIGIHTWTFSGGREALLETLEKAGIDWPVSYDEESFTNPWDSGGIFKTGLTPLYYLVGRDGKALSVSHRVLNLESEIKRRTAF